MLHPHGYAQVVCPDQALWERDTVSCGHCGRIIFVKPGTASTVYLTYDVDAQAWDEVPGAGCSRCWRTICLDCYEVGTCRPQEEWLNQVERQAEKARRL